MHILLTVNAAWNAAHFRGALIAALIKDGHQITVLAPPDDSVDSLTAMGCRFVPLDMDLKGISPRRDTALALRFRRHFKQERPDVVLSFTIKNNVFGGLAAQSLGLPFLPNVTGLGTAFLSGKLLRFVAETLSRRAFLRAPVVFFQNQDDRDHFQERHLVKATQTQLLPGSGIDLERFTPTPQPQSTDAPRFLLIARLLRDKGVYEFVDAARQILRDHPKAEFQLLGAVDSQNRTAIDAATVQDWQAQGLITHLGVTDDVRPHIAAADCIVLPSYREGTPRTLLEAAAMARPLIATDVPGCRQVLNHGETGLLCQVRDAQSLAEKITQFIALPPSERAAMGQAGRRKMEAEFDQKIVIEAYQRALAGLSRH